MQSMEEIYQSYAKLVYRFLLAQTRSPDLAEELTQETFYQAIRSVDRYDGSCAVPTWLCAIAKRVLATWRRRHPDTDDVEEIAKTVPSAEQDALAGMERLELLRMLHRCPEPYREVLYLRLFGGASFREIGAILEKTENWARVTYYRGKERLRKELSDESTSL
jgi:RNA polymerase sigma-70 factor (ECF subfamily)